MLKQILKNSGWLIGERFLRLAVGLIVTSLLSRYLGPVEFGKWGYAIAFVSIFMPIANLELEQIIVKELLTTPEKRDDILGTGILLRFAGSLTIISLVSIINFLFINDPSLKSLSLILSVGFIFQSFDILDFYYHAKLKPARAIYFRSISYLLFAIFKLGLIYYQASLSTIVFFSIFESFLGSLLVLLHFIKEEGGTLKLHLVQKLAMKFIKQSYPIIFANILGMTLIKLDQLFIGKMLSNELVGNYMAATRVSELVYVLVSATTAAAYPVITNNFLTNENKNSQETLFQNLYGGLILFTVLISFGTLLFSHQITNILYGPQFYLTGSLLSIHVWTSIPYSLNLATRHWFVNNHKTGYALILSLICFLIGIALIPTGIYLAGAKGAALSNILILFLNSTLTLFFFADTKKQAILQLTSLPYLFKKYILKIV